MKMMLRTTIFAALLCAMPAVSQSGQQPSLECDKAHAKDCTSGSSQGAGTPSTAQKFPFPGEETEPSKPAEPQSTSQPGGSTAQKFPFPGEKLDQVPVAPEDAPAPQTPSSSSAPGSQGSLPSTASSGDGVSSSSASQEAEPAPTTQSDDAPVTASPLPNYGTKRSKVEEETRRRNEENRVDDDLKIGQFYGNDGNWNGAYLRYKDAAEHDPEEPEAHYGWALAAENLKKLDEAREHYAQYLKLDPSAEHAKEARRALERLNGKTGK